uniref:Uncharacterized protein n=1 Tax=Panagrolaimus superbus TaxID=310955 RepID=A0A914YCW6_9BILA
MNRPGWWPWVGWRRTGCRSACPCRWLRRRAAAGAGACRAGSAAAPARTGTGADAADGDRWRFDHAALDVDAQQVQSLDRHAVAIVGDGDGGVDQVEHVDLRFQRAADGAVG